MKSYRFLAAAWSTGLVSIAVGLAMLVAPHWSDSPVFASTHDFQLTLAGGLLLLAGIVLLRNRKALERTVELRSAYERLERELGERHLAEERLRESEARARARAAELERANEELEAVEQARRTVNEDLLRAQGALAEQERRYRELFELAPDGYVVTDLDGRILEANQAAAGMLQVESPRLLRHPILGFISAPVRPHLEQRLNELRNQPGNSVAQWETEIRPSASDHDIPVSVSIARIRNGTESTDGFHWLLRDVTEHRRAEEKILALNRELEHGVAALQRANRELETFIYSVSHDLRTPLATLQGYVQLLSEEYADRLDEEGRGYLHVLAASVHRMEQQIDGLLALSRLGRQTFQQERIDMEELTLSVVDELRSMPANASVQVEVAPLPAALGDFRMIRQVLLNLLGNGLKFSRRQDPPRIEVTGERREAECVYHVRDNGVGFNMKYADKLFGVFQRLHRDDEFEGTGLGLAIVHRIIERHGGRVWTEGKVGDGAVFSFSLPATPAETGE
jgi:PAS domain S-box-containing protein